MSNFRHVIFIPFSCFFSLTFSGILKLQNSGVVFTWKIGRNFSYITRNFPRESKIIIKAWAFNLVEILLGFNQPSRVDLDDGGIYKWFTTSIKFVLLYSSDPLYEYKELVY